MRVDRLVLWVLIALNVAGLIMNWLTNRSLNAAVAEYTDQEMYYNEYRTTVRARAHADLMQIEFGPCSMCERGGIVMINSAAFCEEHIDDGFALTMRGLAVALGGIDPDDAERIAARLLSQLRGENGDDTPV